MIKNKIRSFFSSIISSSFNEQLQFKEQRDNILYLFKHYANHGIPAATNFDYTKFKKDVIEFTNSKEISPCEFKFSDSVTCFSLYNTVYAILINSLFNVQPDDDMNKYIDFLNSFQHEDGLFYGSELLKSDYKDADWFGIKHLLPHIITCYNYLKEKPKYEFSFLKPFYDDATLYSFLNNLNFNIPNDDDNKVFNLGVALQFQRDYFNDNNAEQTLNKLYEFLEAHINSETGSWGNIDITNKEEYSRIQQIAYHLYVLWLYDNREILYPNKLIDLCLNNQTEIGSFNANLVGSACTDIDCIFLLNKLSKITDYRNQDIKKSLQKAFPWVLTNQNTDGGFVFKRNEPFIYGENALSSKKNESNMFATWFRSLSIAYICDTLNISNSFNLSRCPGYQF